MKTARETPWFAGLLLCLWFCLSASAKASCDTSVDLSTSITEFDARQVPPIGALLKLGESRNLCFGIEYVDGALLTKPADFHLQNTTLRGAIEAILRSAGPFAIEQHYGVIEVIPRVPEPKSGNIFNFVIHKWEARRAPVQLVSMTLYWQLRTELNPQITGYADHSFAGNVRDEVRPFNESNLPVKYLLDKIVAQSKGAAWIAQVHWERVGDFALLEARRDRVWTIVEYEGPEADYSGLLRDIAARL
jgi:hypothetical protein